jgi:hypothetical protein
MDGGAGSEALLLDVRQQVRERGHLAIRGLVVHEEFVCFLADLLQDARGPRHRLAPHEELADVSVLQPIRAPERHAVSGHLREVRRHVLHAQL